MNSKDLPDPLMAKVLSRIDGITGERQRSLAWLQSPLKEFGGQTPQRLVELGRAEDVLGFLDSMSSGFVG
jgi:hypothetical protein